MMFNGIILLYPYVMLLIIVYLLLTTFLKPKNQSIYFSNTKLLKSATKNKGILIQILRFLFVLSVLISLSSPVKKSDVVIDDNKGHEISLILDASGSMKESNKFKFTKQIVSNFIEERKEDRLALSIFADFAYVAVPLTYDKKSLKDLLEHIEVGIAGQRQTALYEALYLSSNLFKTSNSKNKIAILLTDGLDNTNTVPLDVAISKAKKYNIKVYTVGIGRQGDFDSGVLKKISKETNGLFFHANSFEKLQTIYSKINDLETSKIKTKKYVQKEYYFQYPLIFGLLILFLLIIIHRKHS